MAGGGARRGTLAHHYGTGHRRPLLDRGSPETEQGPAVANPRQLMAWLGLAPSEHSSGSRVERGGITKAGNGRARRVLVEGAWSYRFPARVTGPIQARLDEAPDAARAIAWKAQLRLCARFRRLVAAGKNVNLVTTAVAREMAAFAWAIACQVQPKEAAA